MSTESLRRFMTERLLDLDPTLSDQAGSLMFTKVIEPLLTRLGVDPMGVDIQTFIISRLQEEFPELDVNSPGSVLKDVVVSPLSLILEPLRREIFFLRTQNSLADATSLTEPEMDALLTNILSERNLGVNALGTVRCYFNAAKTFGVDSSIIFSTADGVNFTPAVPATFYPENFIRSGNYWYVDVEIRSMEATVGANVPKNAIKFVNGLDNVARVTNTTAMSGGVTSETNEAFIARAERSLSERSLNTERGIETDLFNRFSDLKSIKVIGHGEPEMMRDILEAECNRDLTETLGPLIYMSADWATMEVISGNINVTATAAHNGFPFTNVVVFNAPVGGWDLELKAKMLGAKYLRVSDGNQYYNNTILNRVRVIDEIQEHVSGDIYVRTKDFSVYPRPMTIFSQSTSVPVSGRTDAPYHGLNKRAWQGSEYKMIGGGEDDLDYVTGAHLPFTDHIDTGFDFIDVPGAVIPGQDFLVVISREAFTDDGSPDPADSIWSKKVRTFPILKHFGHDDLGIGRSDGFLVSKERILYKGEANFEYEPNMEYSGLRDHIHIRDFGGPKLSAWEEEDPQSIVYGGQEKEDYGRRPGVAIEGKKVNALGNGSCPDDIEITNAGMAEPQECDIILSTTQSPWSARGISEGDYVACSVYRKTYGGDPYKGKLTDAKEAMLWQAWGRVKKVGYGSPWRLRVEGLDWRPLHIHNHLNFSPTASAEITIDTELTHLSAQGGAWLFDGTNNEQRHMFAPWWIKSGAGMTLTEGYISPMDEPSNIVNGKNRLAGCELSAWGNSGTRGELAFTINETDLGSVFATLDGAGEQGPLQIEIEGHFCGDGTSWTSPPPVFGQDRFTTSAELLVGNGTGYLNAANVQQFIEDLRDAINNKFGAHGYYATAEYDPATDIVGTDHTITLKSGIYSHLANEWQPYVHYAGATVSYNSDFGGAFTNMGTYSLTGNKVPGAPQFTSGQSSPPLHVAAALAKSINGAADPVWGDLPVDGRVFAYVKDNPGAAPTDPHTVVVECIDIANALPALGNGWTIGFGPDAWNADSTPNNAQVDYVHVTDWNSTTDLNWPPGQSYPVGNINGGYLGGFGERRQIAGREESPEQVKWTEAAAGGKPGSATVLGFDFNYPEGEPNPPMISSDDWWEDALGTTAEPHPEHAAPYEELGGVVASGANAVGSPPTFDIGTSTFVFRLNNTPVAQPTNSGDVVILTDANGDPQQVGFVRIVMELELPGPWESTDSPHPDAQGTIFPETKRYKLVFCDDGQGNMVYDPAWELPKTPCDPTSAATKMDTAHGDVLSALGDWLDKANSKINYTTGEVRLAFKEDFELSWPNWSNPLGSATGAGWGQTVDPNEIFEWPAGYDPLGPPRGYTFHPIWSTMSPAPRMYDPGGTDQEQPHDYESGVGGTLQHPSFWAGYSYISNPYRAFYTVYKGMTELLTPTGVNTPSYDEFAFLPAYHRPQEGLSAYEPIHSVAYSGYKGDGWDSDGTTLTGTINPVPEDSRIFSNFHLNDSSNKAKMVWIRLGKGYNVVHPSIGGAPSEKCFTGELVDLDGLQDDIGAMPGNEYSGYTKRRHRNYIPKEVGGFPNPDALDIDGDGNTTDVIVQATSLPLVGGSTNIDDVDKEYPDLDLTDKVEPNEKGLSGFLIPHPMGNNYPAMGLAGGTMDSPPIDLLEHQVAHLYEGYDFTEEDSLLTISGIPGGTPFPGQFGGGLEIVNNQVHIGGMTDVYVKPGSTTEATSEEIRIQPEAPVVPFVEGGEVVFSGNDGKIDCLDNPQHFISATLQAELNSLFGNAPRPLDNLVLEILDPPSPELLPTFFRVVHSTNDGVKIDGEFPESLGLGFENLRFRVMQECSTNLVSPLIILKQGDDLIVHENEMSAFSPSGYPFAANPITSALYLHIDSETAFGEYRIEGINLNTLILTTAITEEGTNLKYRIYIKQGSGLRMPMVRVKSVSLAGDNEGVTVPYKHPVDVVSSDFSGLNDDPINEDTVGVDGGSLSIESVDLNSDGVIDVEPEDETDPVKRLCFTLPAGVNLVEYGTTKYDVLRLEDMFGDEKHWWVESITSAHWPMNDWLSFIDEGLVSPGSFPQLVVTETGATTDILLSNENVDVRPYLKEGDMVKGLDGTTEFFGVVDAVSYDGFNSIIVLESGTGFDGANMYAGDLYFRSLGVNNRLVLDRLQAMPDTIEDLRFTLGHPSIGTGKVYFKDQTFFEADPESVFTYTDPKTQKEWYLRPSPAERALVYKSGYQTTDLRLDNTEIGWTDSARPWRYIVSEDVDFFKHNVLPGDTLNIVSRVLWSDAFMGGLEEEKNLLVGGKTLAVSVNDAIRTCTFSGPNPMTLNDVVSDINRQLGDVLFADVFEYDDNDPPVDEVEKPGFRIRIFSSHDIMLVTQGTIGILGDLRFNDRDNTPTTNLIREFTVSGLEYQEKTGPIPAKVAIRLTRSPASPGTSAPYLDTHMSGLSADHDTPADNIWDRYYDLIFIEIHREKNQRFYPADMEEDGTGLFHSTIRLTSYDPNTSTGIVPDETQLEPYGYHSLGYEVVVSNENYSYSLGEDSSLKTTSVVLDKYSESFEKVFEVTGAGVTVTYDRADVVADVQSYLLLRQARVVCNNPLARHFFPAYPMFSIEHTGTLLDSEVKDKIADFLVALYPNRPLEVFDLVSVLTRTGSSYMLLPQEASFLVHRADRRIKVVRSKNIVFIGNQFHIMEDLDRVKINGK